MVGSAAMGPQPFEVEPLEGETQEEARRRILDRFEKIGLQIMNRTGGGGPFAQDPIAGVLGDPAKRTLVRRSSARRTWPHTTSSCRNRTAVEPIADTLVAKRGDLR